MRAGFGALCWILVFVCLALSTPLAAAAEPAPARLELEIQAVGAEASLATATLRATEAVPAAPENLPVVLEQKARIPGRVALPVPHAGVWRVSLESQEFWASELEVDPEPGVAVLWRVRPTAEVRGELRTAKADGLPEKLSLGFRSMAERPDQPAEVEGTVPCAVAEDGAFGCRPPAGVLDLALRADGFISHYLWAADLAPGGSRELGSLEMRRGASLVGWVETEDRSPITACRVKLEPYLKGGLDPELVARAGQLTISAPVEERGFFQLAGIELGAYQLVVEQAGFATLATQILPIAEVREKRFGEPLILHRPLSLEVAVVPETDARGRAWQLMLFEMGAPEPVALGQTGEGGRWHPIGLAPGSYQLMVNDGQGSRVAMEPIELTPEKTYFLVQLPFFRVEGRVTLGDEPLAANLTFGGASGAVAIALASDAEGKFQGQLPREGEWDVDVTARAPKIFRRLRKVPVVPTPASGKAWVEIELPDTVLEGEVVDETGTAVPDAVVLVLVFPAVEMPSTVRTDAEGHVELRGFEPGAFRLEARAQGEHGQRTSEVVEIHVDKDEGRAEVKLVVRDLLEIRGRVVGSNGSGVPGASIVARPVLTTGSRPLIPPQTMTDVAGGFSLGFSPGVSQADATIAARGFLLTRRLLAVEPSKEWLVPLEPAANGGRLRLVLDKPIGDGFEGRSHPLVIQDGTIEYNLGLLTRWAITNGGQPTAGALVVPAMPAGSYAFCRNLPRLAAEKEKNSPPERECVSGFLAPGGELSLELGSGGE